MLYGYTRNHFFDQCTWYKFTVFPKKCLLDISFIYLVFDWGHLSIDSHLRFVFILKTTFTDKNLRQLHVKTYHSSSRIISLSGDVELKCLKFGENRGNNQKTYDSVRNELQDECHCAWSLLKITLTCPIWQSEKMVEKLNRSSCLVKFCWFGFIAQASRVEFTAARSEGIKSIILVSCLPTLNGQTFTAYFVAYVVVFA